MTVIVSKTKSGPYGASALVGEINSSSAIIPSCMSITAVGGNLSFEFAAALSGAEDTELDSIIANHVKPGETIEVNLLPFSDLDGKKLAVHPSYKPQLEGITTYAVWTGAGDEVDGSNNILSGGKIGGGPLMHLDSVAGVAEQIIDIKFNPESGLVWLHEAYIKFKDAGDGDCICGEVRAEATPTQQAAQMNLDIDVDGWITPATNYHLGEFNGTDGFADPGKIVLVPRTYSHDGDWNFDGISLIPVYDSTGEYKMTAIDRCVHIYVNSIPCYGTTSYFSITSDETTLLPAHYYIRIKTVNVSNSLWHASVLLEIYRERTFNP